MLASGEYGSTKNTVIFHCKQRCHMYKKGEIERENDIVQTKKDKERQTAM